MQKITVIGTGYVGLIAGLGFAKWGNEVVCLDVIPEKIEKLQRGVCPIYEPGAEVQLADGLASGRLRFTCDVKAAVEHGDLIFIAVGVWALIQTYSFQEVKNTYVQAAVFPQIMCVGMLIFAVILLIQSIIKLMTMDENDPLAEPAASINFIKDKGVLAALFVMLLCALFVVFFKPLGYVVCGAVLCFIIMVLIGKRNWLQMVLVSILVPLGMWLVFYKVLTVNIPMGPLQFLRDLVDMI